MPGQDAKYQQVMDWIKQNIENGTFRHGDKLASENELGERFGLSRQTIRHATGELVREHLLTRVRGSGTYICTHDPEKHSSESIAEEGNGTVTPSPGAPGEKEASADPVSMRVMTGNIAVISTFYDNYIFPQTLKGIERVLSKNGYSMQVSFTDNRLHREETILKTILEKDAVDGLIVEPAKSALPNPNIHYYREILARKIPVLFFNASYPGLEAPCVRLDDIQAARKITEYLISCGHTSIGGIFKCDDHQGPLRYQGYLEAMQEAGFRTSQNQILWLDTPETSDLEQIGEYVLRRLTECSAVLCYNDQVANQLIEIADRHHIKVPEELSVAGIDDDTYTAGVSRIPLTTVPHPKEQLGRKAAENLLHLISDPSYDANYLFDCELVERSSVMKR